MAKPVGYHISSDPGKADSDMKKPGPGPVRGNAFDRVAHGPKQGDAKPQPAGRKFDQDKGKMHHEGDGDAS